MPEGARPPEELLVANARFESTTWTATALGPPLGGAAIGLLGPVTTVVANAVSFLLSALGIRAIGGGEPRPARSGPPRRGPAICWTAGATSSPTRRCARCSSTRVLVNGLIMATAPLLAVLMLGRLGFAPWQYGLAFGLPCLGGLIGSRLSRRLVARFGRPPGDAHRGHAARVLVARARVHRAPACAGLALVIAVQFGLVTSVGVFNPVFATYRLEQTPDDRVARTLSAWSVTSNATIAAHDRACGACWRRVTGPRAAIAVAGVLMLATPLLLARREPAGEPTRPQAPVKAALSEARTTSSLSPLP